MSKLLRLTIENDIAIIEFDQPDSKVNVLSAQALVELEDIISGLKSRQDLKGLVLLSKKPDVFMAGADIKEIEKIESASEAQTKAKRGQDILSALEALAIPSLALINGVCLGGGLELALSCDWRLAAFGEKTRLGLPEVRLGIIPGFGGTKRLPRLTGLRKGLEMIVSGETVSAQEALKAGLVDGLAAESRLLEAGLVFIKGKTKKRRLWRPKLKGLVNVLLDQTFSGRFILRRQARKFAVKTTKGHYPAVLKAVAVTAKNYSLPLRQALENEARAFSELVVGPVSKNLISVFYLTEKYKKEKWVEAQARPVEKCGLLGAGVMGGGIAHLLSSRGIFVRMKDINYPSLGRGLRQARDIYYYAVKKKKIKPHQAVLGMGLISPALNYQGFANADLIIEAVVEDIKIKKVVLKELDSLVSSQTIIASNTSSLSVAQMSQDVGNKERVAGLHFFNPVQRMPLVEVIRAAGTSAETIATLVQFAKKIGKTPIVVKDSCGFLVNRILLPYMTEAGFLLEEGLSFQRIDEICLEFGMPMGPFTLMDEIGLDVGYKVAAILEENFGPRMKVPRILKEVYAQKWFGKKTARGFYVYQGKNKQPNPGIFSLLPQRPKSDLSGQDVLGRILYRMVNEAVMCLEEKVCAEPSDVDLGMIMGAGFPPFRGGLLRYADFIGGEKIARDLESFADKFKSSRFAPCAYLRQAAAGSVFFYRSGRHGE